MKTRQLFILLFFSMQAAQVAAQELPLGNFLNSDGFTSRQITIISNDSFHYKVSSCTYEREGTGVYTFRKGKLNLLFKTAVNDSIYQPSVIFKNTEGDSTCVRLKLFDFWDSVPVPFVSLKYMNKAAGKFYGAVSDDKGIAVIDIANVELPVKILVSSVGIQPGEVIINRPGIYHISFPIHVRKMKPFSAEDILVFEVSDFDENKIVVREAKQKTVLFFSRSE